VDAIREICLRYVSLERLISRIEDHITGARSFADPFAEIDALVQTSELIEKGLDPYLRSKDNDNKRYQDAGVSFDWDSVKNVKEKTIGLAKVCCNCALGEYSVFDKAHTINAI